MFFRGYYWDTIRSLHHVAKEVPRLVILQSFLLKKKSVCVCNHDSAFCVIGTKEILLAGELSESTHYRSLVLRESRRKRQCASSSPPDRIQARHLPPRTRNMHPRRKGAQGHNRTYSLMSSRPHQRFFDSGTQEEPFIRAVKP